VEQAFQDLAFLDSEDSEKETEEGSAQTHGIERGGHRTNRSAEEEDSDAGEFTLPGGGHEEDDPDEYQDDAVMSDDDDDEEMDEDEAGGSSVIGLQSDEEAGPRQRPSLRGGIWSRGGQHHGTRTKPLTMGRGFGPGNMLPPSKFTVKPGDRMRQRGIEEWVKGGQDYRFATFFGPTAEDIDPALQTKFYWSTMETLPNRKENHLRRSFWTSDDAREKEVTTTRKWYEKHGRAYFNAGQVVEVIDEDRGKDYMINPGPESMNFLMGDIKKPQVYTLKKGELMTTSKPFGSDPKRRGWVINLGERIQEAQWAPNEQGRTQYLAVAVRQRSTTESHAPLKDPHAPAFTATKPFAASIQLWAFESLDNGELDDSKAPRLENVICTNWGAPKTLEWCPVGVNKSVDSSDDGTVRLGLLAGLWSDGRVRIIDVSHKKPCGEMQEPQYIRYARAAFEVEVPETIPSCIRWLSGTTLAVGTASGILAIWTLTRANMFLESPPDDSEIFRPQPWFHKQLATTYILTLSSGYPSRPTYISTSSADGFNRVFDLRSPLADTTYSERGRALVLAQAWHDHTQSFCSPDEYYLLKHNVVRSYHRSVYSVRIESPVTVCATSPVHPGVLVGGSDGVVQASNAMHKVMNTKARPWQLAWFKHEYRPPVEMLAVKTKDDQPLAAAEQSNDGRNPYNLEVLNTTTNGHSASASDTPTEAVLSQPLTRITEGYKAVQQGMESSDKRYKEGAKYITTYEEKSAISRLAWNPNLKFGTWAVAGTNGGYLRVEDLGV
jgi:transcription factor C subunit 6